MSSGTLQVLLVLVGALSVVFWHRTVEQATREERQSYMKEAVQDWLLSGESPLNLRLLWLAREQIGEYHDGTKRRADGSFVYAQVSAAAGLTILLAGAIVAVTYRDEKTTPLLTTGLTGLGAAIATYVSLTHFRTHHVSLSQLNYYFRHPVVTHLILHAERLAAALGTTKAEEMRADTMKALLVMAQQINAVALKEVAPGLPVLTSPPAETAPEPEKTSPKPSKPSPERGKPEADKG